MRLTQEQIDRANSVNLPQFLQSHGFELKRMSRDEFIWKEHDSLFIHDNEVGECGKWYRFSEHHGGDNIAFVREYMGLDFRQAVELLNNEIYTDLSFRPYHHEKPKFRAIKPDKPVEIHLRENQDCRKVIDYLCRVRGLDFSLVSELINEGRISQESSYYGNAIFKYFDENNKLVGAEKCGTTEGKKFKSIEKGSASGYGFEVVRGNGENALFFESAIDMLSYLQMHPELDNHRLVSMMGVKPSIVVATMERYGIKPENVYLCSDNDDAGNDFADRLKEVYPDMKRLCSDKKYKDWNDQLRDIPIREVTTEKMIVYGNKIWNYATDNSDKTIITMQESDFKNFARLLEDSGLNYFAYLKDDKIIMAMNDGDVHHLRQIAGETADTFQTSKSNRPYAPPMKNIVGNTPYREIYPKEYINLDRDTALKLAERLERENIRYSGRIYPNGKATLTVSRNDRSYVETLKTALSDQRKRYMENIPYEGIVGNTDYHEIVNRKIIFSDYTKEQFQECEPFIGNQAQYAGVIQHGKIMFMTEEQNEQNFRNLLKRADNIVAIRHECENKNLSEEQITSLQTLIEKCAEKQNLTCIPAFFEARYSAEQFEQMKQAVSSYLDKAQSPDDLQDLKEKFDKQADLSDFFAHHDYDAEQKAAISENFDSVLSISAFERIDESFNPDQISKYFSILRSSGYEDAEKFVENHCMMMSMSDEMLDYYSALSNHQPVYLHKESGSEFQNERIEYHEDSGFVIVGDTENESDLIRYHFQTNSPEVMISNVFQSGWFEQNGYVLDGLENPNVAEEIEDFAIFEEIPETESELTDEEKFFQNCDIISALTEDVLASDEIEDLAYRFYESGYIETHAPSDTAIYGNHLKEHDLYDLIYAMYSGEDISKDLAVGLIGAGKNSHAHYGENYSDYIEFSKEQTETGFLLTYGSVQREVTYQALSDKFLSMFKAEYDDIQKYRDAEKQAETPEKPELTEHEKYFQECDISAIMAKNALSENEIERLGYIFFQERYIQNHNPSEQRLFGWDLYEPDVYTMAFQHERGENISKDLCSGIFGDYDTGWLKHGEDTLEFGKEQTETGVLLSYGSVQREVSYQELADAFLNLFHEKFEEITHNSLMNSFRNNMPDIDEKTAENLIHTFDRTKRPDWQDNIFKRRKIKNALFEILNDDEKTEKAFSIISFWKYGYDEKYDAPEKTPVVEESPIHFGLLGNGETVYDVSRTNPETNDYVTVAHISPEGVLSIYDNKISDSDMQIIQNEAQLQRERFMQDWNALPLDRQYGMLISNADIETSINISREKLSPEEIIEKYMPFVFFKEGGLPEPELVMNIRTEEEKQSTLMSDLTDIVGEEQADSLIPELMQAFENSAVSGWEDNDPEKAANIKSALFDVLEDEEQTEEVYGAFLKSTSPYSVDAQQNYDILPQNGTYSIYQLHGGEEYHGIRFESLETLQNENITLNYTDYEKVYEGELPDFKGKQTLEELFEKFNLDRPADFTGHSLSVSDIIVTEINGSQTAYYCDKLGFMMMPDFFKEKAVETEISESEPEQAENIHQVIVNYGFDGGIDEKLEYPNIDDAVTAGREYFENEGIEGFCVYNQETKIIEHTEGNFDPKEIFRENILRINHLLDEPEEIQKADTSEQNNNTDAPLFTDADVIQTIQENEHADDFRFYPDTEGEQLSLFGEPEPMPSKNTSKQKEEQYKTGLVVGGVNRFKALSDDVMRGTGFQDGKFRVQEFYQKNHPTNQEFADFLKNAYGTGAHSGDGDISFVDYNSKGMIFTLETGEKFKFTWSEVAEEISEKIQRGEYLTQQDMEMHNRLSKTEPTPVEDTNPDSQEKNEPVQGIGIGDKFRNKRTGEISEVISLTGALPWYTDQSTVSRKSGMIQITENVDDNDLLNPEKYERVPEVEKVIENPAPEKSEPEVKLRSIVIDLTAPRDEVAKIPDEPEKNFHITDDALGEGGQKAKFQANIQAIQTLKTLEKENRPATPEERETLSRYVGWGGIAQAFDANNEKWSAEYQQLKELLTNQEYTSARASTLNAFYTTPLVIDSIYQALENFGFEGGNILEPSCGVGNFFGCMPEDMRKDSDLYGVELDSISGRIAQKIYPDATIAIQGFEKNEFQNGCFDVAVGNVPFGDLSFKDDKHQTTKLHDYFFAEAMDKVKTGGIIAFVTSAGTLDKADERTRQALAEQADLIGAVRLPSTAFKQNANTEVTTDIIFLQKRSEPPAELPEWIHLGETENGLPINKYFEQNPDMILGEVVEGNKLYGKSGTMVVPFEGADLKEQLQTAISKLSATISDERAKDVYAKTEHGEVKIPSNLRNYSFFEHENHIYFKTSDRACAFRFDRTNSHHRRAKAFIELRDTTRELLTAQELDKPDSEIKELQAKLNRVYDNFYKKFGLLHSRTNKKLFSEDVSYNLVCSLEKEFDKNKLIAKSDLFTKRTIRPPQAVEHVESAVEALTLSMAEKAKVNFQYMTELTGMTEDELKKELEGQIFKIPHTENEYQTASEYLSGDIYKKLKIAEEIAEYDSDFSINVTALKQAIPTPLKAGDIEVKLGAAWIDPKLYQQFLYETLNTPYEYRDNGQQSSGFWRKPKLIQVEYSQATGTFHIEHKREDMSVNATQNFGSKHMNAYEIMEQLLNLKEPKIYKTIKDCDEYGAEKEKRVIDSDATHVVQKKAEKLREEFSKWIFRDPQRREQLVNQYNEQFNSVRPREYDGSHLTFPMMNSEIQLHEHQKNAVAHALFGGNTLFAHTVGAGKTFEMIATAMEAKRLGLCTKSLFAVPNHLTEQIGDDFMKLYPSANILVATKNDFKKENRQQLFAKIATGNFDAVIIGHSQLGMIPVSKERQRALIQEQIDDILIGIEEMKKQDGSKFQVKQMERTRNSLEGQLEKLEKSHDDTITFEQMGIDRLFVDEMHEFKNLFVKTKLSNISGVSTSASQKALDLFLKVRYLDEKTGGKGFVAATGTPLSNSVTELHTMMRYLEYDFLQEHNLQNFDNWVTIFGQQQTDWELAPAGNNVKAKKGQSFYFALCSIYARAFFRSVSGLSISL